MILSILSAMAMGVLGEAVTQFTKRIPFKPFNCALCVTFWLSLFVALGSFNHALHVVQFVGIAVFTRQLMWRLCPTMF